MDVKTLEKSMEPAGTSSSTFWSRNGSLLVGCALMSSLIANCVLYDSYSQESKQHDWFAKSAQACEDSNGMLRDQIDGQRRDIQAMLNAGDAVNASDLDAFGAIDQEDADAFSACRNDPVGLSLPRTALGLHGTMAIDNPDPIANEAGRRFFPGDRCDLGRDEGLKVTKTDDRAVVIGIDPGDGPVRDRDCPRQAYHVVSGRNSIVEDVILKACLRKRKAERLGLDR